MQRITVIHEKLAALPDLLSNLLAKEVTGNWQGISKTMTPDLQISSPVATSWKRLEDLAEDYRQLYFSGGIAISCPPKVTSGQEFICVVDWLVNSTLLQRGIYKYNTSGFTSFTLQIFNLLD